MGLTVSWGFTETSDSGELSGSFTDGSSITITGSGFGTKSPALPVVWADFESDTNPIAALSVNDAWSASQNWSRTTSNQPTNSTGCCISPSLSSAIASVFEIHTDSFTNFFGFCRRYYTYQMVSNTSNDKIIRVWGDETYPDFYYFHLDCPTNGDRIHVDHDGRSTAQYYLGNGCPPPDAWFIDEYAFKKNSVLNATDGIAKLWRNGDLFGDEDAINTHKYDDESLIWTDVAIGSRSDGTAPGAGEYWYIDDIYLDTSWARVMIGNNAAFASATHREPLIPTAWSDTEITAVVHQGTFGDTDPVWIYVIDSTGAVVKTISATLGNTY